MLALRGTYENGFIKLDNPINIDKPLKVIVTFVDENINFSYQLNEIKQEKATLDINEFSFMKSLETSKDFKGSFSDAIIEERSEEL